MHQQKSLAVGVNKTPGIEVINNWIHLLLQSQPNVNCTTEVLPQILHTHGLDDEAPVPQHGLAGDQVPVLVPGDLRLLPRHLAGQELGLSQHHLDLTPLLLLLLLLASDDQPGGEDHHGLVAPGLAPDLSTVLPHQVGDDELRPELLPDDPVRELVQLADVRLVEGPHCADL